MNELATLYTETDELESALSWVLSQWISDTDPEWRDHVLYGLAVEDPDIYATLNAVNEADAGEPFPEALPVSVDGGDAPDPRPAVSFSDTPPACGVSDGGDVPAPAPVDVTATTANQEEIPT